MKTKLFACLAAQLALIGALIFFLLPAIPLSAQTRISNMFPVVTAASRSSQMPKGFKIIASIPLQGEPVTRMYTQDEYSHMYLYIEHGPESLTAIDITKERNPQLVDHKPARIAPTRYEQLWEGGSIQVSPLFTVSMGFDNQGVRGTLSTLEISNPEDARLLRAFGKNYANLVDRDRRLLFIASARYLFVVQDGRLTATDFISN